MSDKGESSDSRQWQNNHVDDDGRCKRCGELYGECECEDEDNQRWASCCD